MSESVGSAEKLVREFCQAWTRKDARELLGYFTEDSVYHNMPMPEARGPEAIAQVFNFFLPIAEKIEWEILNLVADGNLVFTERVDRFVIGGKSVDLPVAGIFEVQDGKIKAWRDYFDMQAWTNQVP
ncbi:MAG: limonene-1,2-epoxide hydrolase family protein [Deltaproteobacteria bacterium]